MTTPGFLIWDFDGTHPQARAGWMIGDSWRADVQGASAVGMRSILVREKHPGAAVQCDSLHDIVEIVDGL